MPLSMYMYLNKLWYWTYRLVTVYNSTAFEAQLRCIFFRKIFSRVWRDASRPLSLLLMRLAAEIRRVTYVYLLLINLSMCDIMKCVCILYFVHFTTSRPVRVFTFLFDWQKPSALSHTPQSQLTLNLRLRRQDILKPLLPLTLKLSSWSSTLRSMPIHSHIIEILFVIREEIEGFPAGTPGIGAEC